MRRLVASFVMSIAFSAAAPALSPTPQSPTPQAPAPWVAADPQGVAIGGYDPVGYFTQGRPVAGSAAHQHRWNGATWRFASAETRGRFAADPEAFAPRYGGWCAWAMSEGRLAAADPRVWRIVDGRLYLNCSARAQSQWEAGLPETSARADANWARLTGNRQ